MQSRGRAFPCSRARTLCNKVHGNWSCDLPSFCIMHIVGYLCICSHSMAKKRIWHTHTNTQNNWDREKRRCIVSRIAYSHSRCWTRDHLNMKSGFGGGREHIWSKYVKWQSINTNLRIVLRPHCRSACVPQYKYLLLYFFGSFRIV